MFNHRRKLIQRHLSIHVHTRQFLPLWLIATSEGYLSCNRERSRHKGDRCEKRPHKVNSNRALPIEAATLPLSVLLLRKQSTAFQADTQYLKGPHITAVDEKGLETAVLGLEFRVANKHFKRGDMKLKCLATIATVYLQSKEESVEGDERILKAPVMESRETRAQSHTRNDLINGKIPGDSPSFDQTFR